MHKEVPAVLDCSALKCAYNSEKKCQAIAITVGGPGEKCPLCDTEMFGDVKGGTKGQESEVGACHRDDCAYNRALECNACPGIHVGVHEGHADCETYESREKK